MFRAHTPVYVELLTTSLITVSKCYTFDLMYCVVYPQYTKAACFLDCSDKYPLNNNYKSPYARLSLTVSALYV